MARTTVALFLIAGIAVSGCRNEPGTAVPSGAGTAASTAPAAGGQVASTQGAAAAPLTISQRGPGAKGTADTPQLAVPRTLELTHVAPAHYAAALGKDPARMFAFVRDHIAYEAYPGCLRGPRGTLLALSGNSVDRAALLADLLAQSGHKVRFARGTLPDGDARELVTSMWADRPRAAADTSEAASPALTIARDTLVAGVTRDFTRIRGHLEKAGQRSVAVPGPTLDSLVNEARNHYWIEWSKDGAWVALDPSFGDAVPGQTYTKTDETFGALPDAVFHRVTTRVRLEEYEILLTGTDEVKPSRRELLRYTARSADLAGSDLVLAHQPENWKGPTRDLQGGIAAALEDTGRVRPVLFIGDGKWDLGEAFRQRPPAGGGLGQIGVMLGGAGTRTRVPVAVAESIEFEFTDPSGRTETVVRDIFDVVGKARRASGKTLNAEEVRARTGATTTTVDLTRSLYDVFFSAGRIDASHLANLATGPSRPPGAPVDARTALRRTNIAFVAASDGLMNEIRDRGPSAILFYPDAPRVQILEASTIGGNPRFALDLRRTTVRGVALNQSHTDALFWAQTYRGVVEGTLERVFLEYVAAEQTGMKWESGASTSRLFELGEAQGVSSVLLTQDGDAWTSGASEDTLARVREDVRRGQWVVVPERGVRLGEETRFAWWRIDPTSGAAIAVTDEGLHQVAFEYKLTGEHTVEITIIAGGYSLTFEASVIALASFAELAMRLGTTLTRRF